MTSVCRSYIPWTSWQRPSHPQMGETWSQLLLVIFHLLLFHCQSESLYILSLQSRCTAGLSRLQDRFLLTPADILLQHSALRAESQKGKGVLLSVLPQGVVQHTRRRDNRAAANNTIKKDNLALTTVIPTAMAPRDRWSLLKRLRFLAGRKQIPCTLQNDWFKTKISILHIGIGLLIISELLKYDFWSSGSCTVRTVNCKIGDCEQAQKYPSKIFPTSVLLPRAGLGRRDAFLQTQVLFPMVTLLRNWYFYNNFSRFT